MAETYGSRSIGTQEWWERSQTKARAANKVRRNFTDDIESGRLGRYIMPFEVSEGVPDTAFWQASGNLNDEEELVIGGVVQGAEDYDVLQRVSSPDDIRFALIPFDGGTGKLHIHALPAGSYDAYRERLREAGL